MTDFNTPDEDTRRRLGVLIWTLETEAEHWAKHPDRVVLKTGEMPYDEMRTAREKGRIEFQERFHQSRSTHTDIVLRGVATELRQIGDKMGWWFK